MRNSDSATMEREKSNSNSPTKSRMDLEVKAETKELNMVSDNDPI